LRISCLALAAVVWMALPARAATPVLPDIQRVIDSGKLVVELGSQDVPPMVTTDAKGALTGFDVDLARALAEQLGVEPEFRRQAGAHDQIVAAVARGEADIGMALLSATAERAKHVLFTRPYTRQSIAALINRKRDVQFQGRCPKVGSGAIHALARQRGQVGIEQQSATAGWFREEVPDAKLTEYAGLNELFEAARVEKVPLAILGEIAARRLLFAHPAASIQLKLCVLDTRPDSIAIAVRPDAPGLARWIDTFLQERSVFYDAEVLGRYQGPWTFRMGDPLQR
jgi:polar amino acid transport system substrate-binding protein